VTLIIRERTFLSLAEAPQAAQDVVAAAAGLLHSKSVMIPVSNTRYSQHNSNITTIIITVIISAKKKKLI
jgi:hypothetical protein